MKSYIKILFLLFVILTSCSKEKEELPYLELSETSLSFAWTGGSHRLYIDANMKWQLSSVLPSWIDMDVVSESEVNFVLQENETLQKRDCKILFSTESQDALLLIEQRAKETLFFEGLKEYTFSAEECTLKVEVEHNVPYVVEYLGEDYDWIQQVKNGLLEGFDGSTISFSIDENLLPHERFVKIVIQNKEYQLSDTLSITQYGGGLGKYTDGEYVIKFQSIRGKANLVVLGDGFVSKSLRKEGDYERVIDDAISYFFSIEPYKTYRDYFNVYMVVAESEEEGVGEKSLFGGGSVNNKFSTAFGSGTEIVCDSELIFEYAHKVKELPEDKPVTVLVVLNSTKYAGTAYLYANGNSIALCPMSAEASPNDFEGIVHHEAGGHAFGFLCDEYVYYDEEMPESRKNNIKEWQKLGFQMNLDFTDNPNEVLWNSLIGIDKYEATGLYEGGYEYKYGVWRPEENSCMNNNISYYNAWSRWCIVNRIMQLSGLESSISDFIDKDDVSISYNSRSSGFVNPLPPLGESVWIK